MRAPDFWYGQGASASLTAALLSPLGVLYGAIGRLRRAVVQPYDCGRPVVCVGNLVAGGAGKTPVALSLVTALQRRGLSVHCLSRGYGGRESGPLRVDREHHSYREVGDEPLLLAAQAPTWIARDRAAGARAAVTAGAEVIVMDDGFQNPSVKKTLSLLVIDGAVGLGNGRLIPAGPLREAPSAGLARAQAAVILGQDRRGLASQLPTQLPVLDAALMPPAKGWTPAGQRFLAFAGIGRPEKFFTTPGGPWRRAGGPPGLRRSPSLQRRRDHCLTASRRGPRGEAHHHGEGPPAPAAARGRCSADPTGRGRVEGLAGFGNASKRGRDVVA